ncbi:hypothetical protein KEHDKFFH_15315 [Marinobacter maroccanus]|uniref:Antitoxin n=1 Tax=Marinobacter maroccanus TaxID=2055143 RepID=A0A2S5Z7X4_9GAMM|nr:hypothetical protein [Marinobacter maroccanus]PPI83332.1 hypothetical protein KEHDKFFH_15315 [Marinobacter maroccanus]
MTKQQSQSPLSVPETVTISDLRRNPTRCFSDATVEVTYRGEKVGYLMSSEQFEIGLKILAQVEDPEVLKEKLGLTDSWLKSLGEPGQP